MRIGQGISLVEIGEAGGKKKASEHLGSEDELPSSVRPLHMVQKKGGKIAPTWTDKREVKKKLDRSFVKEKGVHMFCIGIKEDRYMFFPISFYDVIEFSTGDGLFKRYCWHVKVKGDTAWCKRNEVTVLLLVFQVLYLYLYCRIILQIQCTHSAVISSNRSPFYLIFIRSKLMLTLWWVSIEVREDDSIQQRGSRPLVLPRQDILQI